MPSRNESDEAFPPGSYEPELLTVNWFDVDVSCSLAEGNLDGRMLTLELSQLDPVVGTFAGEATCVLDDADETVTARLTQK